MRAEQCGIDLLANRTHKIHSVLGGDLFVLAFFLKFRRQVIEGVIVFAYSLCFSTLEDGAALVHPTRRPALGGLLIILTTDRAQEPNFIVRAVLALEVVCFIVWVHFVKVQVPLGIGNPSLDRSF